MKAPPPVTDITDPRWVRAIAHPLRIRLLAMLGEQDASPVVLAEKLGEPLGTVSYHVRTLYELGLIDLVGTRPRRGATEHIYRAKPNPRFTDEAWDQLGAVPKQRMITAVLNQIHEYASRSAAAGGFDPADAHFTRIPLRLDPKGWEELARTTKTWLDQVTKIEQKAARRLARQPDTGIDVGLVILLFEALPFSAEPSVEPDDPDAAQHTRRPGGRRRARSTNGR